MTQKKFGKILLLLSAPHLLTWGITGSIIFGNDFLPAWMFWWLLIIFINAIVGGYLAEETTPKQTWKAIIKFINE